MFRLFRSHYWFEIDIAGIVRAIAVLVLSMKI